MPTDEELLNETELDDAGNPIVQDPPEPLNDFPEYATKGDLSELKETIQTLAEVLKTRSEPPAPIATPVAVQKDERTPMQIAEAEAEAQGIDNYSWVYQRALILQDQASQTRLQELEQRLMQTVAGAVVPMHQDRIVKQLANGDAKVEVEIQKMIQAGIVDAGTLANNESIQEVVMLAAQAKAGSAGKPFPAAAPAGGGSGPALSGLRARLTPEQLREVKQAEDQYGYKFDDAMIQESYGATLGRR